MLRMSKLADYGTVVMTCMAREPERMQSAAELALATGLTLPTVGKILKRMAQAGLLVSQRGAHGGYLLAQQPGDISVAVIIDAIEGYPMGLTECSSVPGMCERESCCGVRANWQQVSQIVRGILDRMTLAELADPRQVVKLHSSDATPGVTGA